LLQEILLGVTTILGISAKEQRKLD